MFYNHSAPSSALFVSYTVHLDLAMIKGLATQCLMASIVAADGTMLVMEVQGASLYRTVSSRGGAQSLQYMTRTAKSNQEYLNQK